MPLHEPVPLVADVSRLSGGACPNSSASPFSNASYSSRSKEPVTLSLPTPTMGANPAHPMALSQISRRHEAGPRWGAALNHMRQVPQARSFLW